MLGIMLFSSIFIIFMADCPYATLILMFCGIFGFSGIVLPEQKMGEENPQTAEVTKSAIYLTSLSFGNAVGATLGALPMVIGYSVEFSAVPAVIILASSLALLYYFYQNYQIIKQ